MATYYVRPDGNNANAGTADSAAGAWQTIQYAIKNANNGVLANADTVFVVGDQGAYTENMLVNDRAIALLALRGPVTVDGTGGGAGSDGFSLLVTGMTVVRGFIFQNCVDRGFDAIGATPIHDITALSCGGNGIMCIGAAEAYGLRARACGGVGISHNVVLRHFYAEASDNASHGLAAGSVNPTGMKNCLFFDNGGDGARGNMSADASAMLIQHCTFEGNTGDGLELTAALSLPAGAIVKNCAFTNNGGYGVNSSAGAQTNAASLDVDYNNYYGNNGGGAGGDRNNFPTGAHDTANAPGYVNAAGDDYTLDTGSAMIGAGYSPFKSPMKVNQGATIAEVAAVSGGLPGNLAGGILQ